MTPSLKNRDLAAKILTDAGWTFTQIEAVLVKKSLSKRSLKTKSKSKSKPKT